MMAKDFSNSALPTFSPGSRLFGIRLLHAALALIVKIIQSLKLPVARTASTSDASLWIV